MTVGPVRPGGEVLLYEAPDGSLRLDVRLDRETVWLSASSMASLFERDKSVILKHLRAVYRSGELERGATVAKNATVQREGDREVVREVEYFNLDAILSVGYRVNSRRGVQFRTWATRTLREHLLRGYTLNERRLREAGFREAEQAIALLARSLTAHELVSDEGQAVLDVVQRYSRSWRLLFDYDKRRLPGSPARPRSPTVGLGVEEARATIASLRRDLVGRGEASDLFGWERGEGLAGILGAVEQSFGGQALYPSVQARAAHLLYFIVKDHPFGDGNKRIGTLIFLDYLHRNGLLFRADGQPRFADNALVALALLVAASEPGQKDLMVRLVMSLIEDDLG